MASDSERDHGDEPLELPDRPAGPDLLTVAWRRKWVIVLGCLVGLGLSYMYYLQRPAVYQSAAQLLVVKKRPTPLPIQGMEGQMLMTMANEDYLATHMVLIRSPLVVGQAAKRPQLHDLRSFQGRGDLTGAIMHSLAVRREGKEGGGTRIVEVSFRGPIAEDCPKVINAVVESYADFLGETYQDVSDKTLELITQARNVLKKDIDEKENGYLKFLQDARLLWKGKEGSNVHQDRLASIESAISNLLVRRAETESQLKVIESAIASGGNREALAALITRQSQSSLTGQRSGSSSAPESRYSTLTLEEQLLPLEIEHASLLERYGPDHPQVRSVVRRMDMTRDFFARQADVLESQQEAGDARGKAEQPAGPVQMHVDSLKQELNQSRELEESLGELFQRESSEATALAKYEFEDSKFRKDIERTQQLYDGIIKRLQEIDLIKDYGAFTTQVISPAGVGVQIDPSLTRMLPMGAILGILAGFGLGYLIDISDKTFRSAEEIRKRLEVPVVGHIPFLVPAENGAVSAGNNGAAGLDPMVCTYYRPKSRDAEAFRAVRTAIYFSTRGEGHKVIQITSPRPGDGKTTLAANLAVSIAQSGKRILLMDADFRRPRQHRMFGLEAKTGLASVFCGEAELMDAIQSTSVPGLSVLPCGAHPPNPAELLSSSQFQEIVEMVREKFDFVLIDTPPLLAVTDPCAVAPRVDGVILTLRVAKNGRPDAERSTEILNTLGATLLGVVVNGLGGAGGYAYQYGGYGYHYGGYGGYRYDAAYGGYGAEGYASGYYDAYADDAEEGNAAEAAAAGDEATHGPDAGTDRPAAHKKRAVVRGSRRFFGWLRRR